MLQKSLGRVAVTGLTLLATFLYVKEWVEVAEEVEALGSCQCQNGSQLSRLTTL